MTESLSNFWPQVGEMIDRAYLDVMRNRLLEK